MARRVELGFSKYAAGGVLLAGLLGLVVLLYMSLSGPLQSTATVKGTRILPPTVGSPVPDFELSRLDGSPQRLSKLEGTPLVINFWATWCEPCKEEMPLFERYSTRYAGKLVILGVNSEEEADVVQPFIQGLRITFPILMDRSGSVSDRYFVKDFPYTFFVDQDGILRGQHLGLLSEENLVRYLQTIGIKP